MKIIWKLFIIAFLFCLFVSDLPSILSAFLFQAYPGAPDLVIYIQLSTSVLSIILVLIEFGIFYIIGRNYDLKNSLSSSMVSIYLGAAIGLIATTVLIILIVPSLGASGIIDGTFFAYAFISPLIYAVPHLFTDIAGLAVSNVRHNLPIT